MSKRTKKAAAVVVVILNCFGLAFANATNVGTATNSIPQLIGSGSWKVVPSVTTVNPVIRDTAAAKGSYFTITNTGTLQTLSFTLGQTTTTTSGTNAYTVLLNYCRVSGTVAGTWSATGTCNTGVLTNMLTNTNASTNSAAVTFTLAPLATISVQCQYHSTTAGAPGNRNISDAISVTVTRANVRTATSISG